MLKEVKRINNKANQKLWKAWKEGKKNYIYTNFSDSNFMMGDNYGQGRQHKLQCPCCKKAIDANGAPVTSIQKFYEEYRIANEANDKQWTSDREYYFDVYNGKKYAEYISKKYVTYYDMKEEKKHIEYEDILSLIYTFECSFCKKEIKACVKDVYGRLAKEDKEDVFVFKQVPTYDKNSYCQENTTTEVISYDNETNKIVLFASYTEVLWLTNLVKKIPSFCKLIVDLNNNTIAYYTPKFKKPTSVWNATYGLTSFSAPRVNNAFSKKALKEVICLIGEKKGFSEEVMRECEKQLFSLKKKCNYYHLQELLNSISVLNRMPNLLIRYDSYSKKTDVITDVLKNEEKRLFLCTEIKAAIPSSLEDTEQLINKLVDKFNLPKSKKFMALYREKLIYIDRIYYLLCCGFKNKDVLLSLVSNKNFIDALIGRKGNINKNKTFFKYYLKKKDEIIIKRDIHHLLSGYWDTYILFDALNLFSNFNTWRYKKLFPRNLFTLSIKEIHDELSCLYTKIKYENKEIKYSEKENELESAYKGYEFKLPVDTNELVQIGTEMKICVGGYREMALRKTSTIISIRKNDTYVGCIELNPSNSSDSFILRQAKAKRNAYFKGELATIFKKWCKNKGIKELNKCNDYRSCEETEEDNQEERNANNNLRDYHYLELDENNDVVNARHRIIA